MTDTAKRSISFVVTAIGVLLVIDVNGRAIRGDAGMIPEWFATVGLSGFGFAAFRYYRAKLRSSDRLKIESEKQEAEILAKQGE